MRARGIAWLAASLLAGCAVFGTATADKDGGFADYLREVLAMDAAQVQAQADELARRTSAAARLRRAMLLAAPASPERDDARALAAAAAIAQSDQTPAATRDAAALFAKWLDEQRGREEDARLARARAEADLRSMEELGTRLRDVEKRALAAERKLEALKQIDREMTDRPSGNGARP